MIPVRLPTAFEPHIVRDDLLLAPDHPFHGQECPVCFQPLGADMLPVALVAIGIAPASRQPLGRRPSGWSSGAAVAVHTACARPPMDADTVHREPFLVTVHDQDSGDVMQRRVPLHNYIVIPTGRCEMAQLDIYPEHGTHVIQMLGVQQPPQGSGDGRG